MKAKEILKLYERWSRLDSDSIADNVTEVLIGRGYGTFTSRWNALTEMTASKKDAVYAWLNKSRKRVKIPFIKLCKIADATNFSIDKLLTGGISMFDKKFAVIHVVDNDETVLKTFDQDAKAKAEAIAYAEEIFKSGIDHTIVCGVIPVDEKGKRIGTSVQVFKVLNEEDRT